MEMYPEQAKRKDIGKRLRFEIFKRDGFKCLYCGATPVQKVLRVDHVKPVAEGGGNEPENLVTACFDCNAGKADVPLEKKRLAAGIARDEDREHAEQIREWLSIQRTVADAKDEVLDDLCEEWTRKCGTTPDGLRNKLRLLVSEFGVERLMEAIDIVASHDRLYNARAQVRYLYGIARHWRIEPPPFPTEPETQVPEISPRAKQVFERVSAELSRVKEANGRLHVDDLLRSFALNAYGYPDDLQQSYDPEIPDISIRGLLLKTAPTSDGKLRWKIEDEPDWALAEDIHYGCLNARHELSVAFRDGAGRDVLERKWLQFVALQREAYGFQLFCRTGANEDYLRQSRDSLGWPNPPTIEEKPE